MSLILEALHRSEQERKNPDRIPDINSGHMPSAEEKVSRVHTRYIIEFCLALILIFYLLYDNGWLSDEESIEAIIERGEEHFASAVETGDAKLAALAGDVKPAQKNDELRSDATVEQAPEKPLMTVEPKVEVAKNFPAVAELYKKQREGEAPLKPEKESVALSDLSSDTTKPKEKVNKKDQLYNDLPLISQLSPVMRASIPGIDYSVHMYSEEEGQGVATLNDKPCRVGDTIVPGLRVVDVLTQGVILDFQGVLFKMPALSSWVNF